MPCQQYTKQCQRAYLVSKLLAPSLKAVGVKTMRGRQGFCELSCNGPSIASEGEGSFVHVPLPWSHICQDELDSAAPLGGLPKVQLPVQPAVIELRRLSDDDHHPSQLTMFSHGSVSAQIPCSNQECNALACYKIAVVWCLVWHKLNILSGQFACYERALYILAWAADFL